MAIVALHYWAAARAAAGVEWERYAAASVADALAQAGISGDRTALAEVLKSCSFLVEGVTQHIHDLDTWLPTDIDVEVLPPFAGG